MIETIICALDFNSGAGNVLEWAAEIGKQHDASLIILFTYRLTPSQSGEDVHELRTNVESMARARFLEIEKKLLKSNVHSYTFLVEIGFLSDRIISHAKRNENSILIVANDVAKSISEHDDSGFTNYLEELKIPAIILPAKPSALG